MTKREMTIEEAIEIFKEVREEVIAKETELSKQVFENLGLKAIELAIKVLEERLEIHDTCKKCIEFSNFEQKPCGDCISRTELLARIDAERKHLLDIKMDGAEHVIVHHARRIIEDMPSLTPHQTRWIPVSERLPEDLEPVNITWVNHEPEPYYHDIKDRNFVATGIYYRGQWYWYSTTCADYLGEYGSNEIDKVDDAVEIIAWVPLPEPYRSENE